MGFSIEDGVGVMEYTAWVPVSVSHIVADKNSGKHNSRRTVELRPEVIAWLHNYFHNDPEKIRYVLLNWRKGVVKHHNGSFMVSVEFRNEADAVAFKLAWG